MTQDTAKIIAATDRSPRGDAFLRALLDLATRVAAGDPEVTEFVVRRNMEVHGGPDAGREELPWHRRLAAYIRDHSALVVRNHRHGFTVILEACTYIQNMELWLLEHLLPTSSYDLADGSISGCWSNYRHDVLGRRRLEPQVTARIYSPAARGEVAVIVYPEEELLEFRHWLHDEYMPKKLAEYLRRKFKGNLRNLAPVSAADHCCKSIVGRDADLKPKERRLLTAAGGIIRLGDKVPALTFGADIKPDLFSSLD